MAELKWMKAFVASVMCTAIFCVQVDAAGPVKQKSSKVADVSLAKDGLLVGRVLSTSGRAEAGSEVMLRYDGRTVAETRTDAQGRYAIKGVRGGVHEVLTPKGRQVVRLWPHQTAPPIARPEAVMINGREVIRGQISGGPDLISLGLLGLSATSTYFAVKNEGDIDDLEEENAAQQRQLQSLQSGAGNFALTSAPAS